MTTDLNELIGIVYMASQSDNQLEQWYYRVTKASTDPVYREQVINLIQSAHGASRDDANKYINLSTKLVESEFNRRGLPIPKLEEKTIDENKLDEPVLPDDYPVYAGYLYVCDGRVTISDLKTNVIGLKAKLGVREVRRCDLVGRELL